MAEKLEVKELDQVVVRFSGDSGDGMQLAGNIFSTVSATVGNGISTFPDYPADIRAPQGSLTGVSGFQVHIGSGKVYTPGDKCDVLVAMNAAALKTQYRYAKPGATIIIDTDSFGPKDLEKAQFKTEDYLGEMNIDPDRVIQCPLTTMVKQALMPPPPSGPLGGSRRGQHRHEVSFEMPQHVCAGTRLLALRPRPGTGEQFPAREVCQETRHRRG